MTASDHLSGQQFFHGSDHPFETGDVVTSPKSRNAEGNFGTAEPDRVYLSNSRSYAKGFGQHVYRVEPHDEPVDTGYVGGRNGNTKVFHASAATVVKRVGGQSK